MDKLVSVIITTYGRKYELIKKSIDSVFNQTYKNIELILVDDNDSKSVFRLDIQKKINKDIIYIKHEKNKGAQVSRNDGIINANGELIAFLDDDDEWLPLKLEMQVNAIKKDKNIGLVYSKGYTIIEETKEKRKYVTSKNFHTEVSLFDELYGDYIGTTSQVLIKKEVFDKVGMFDINQPARQDYEMWIRICKKYKCVGVEEYLFNHYIHDGEQISKNPKKAAVGMHNIYIKYKKDYKTYPLAEMHMFINLSKYYKANDEKNYSIKWKVKAILKLPKVLLFDFKNLVNKVREHYNNEEF